jgi:phenylacetate-coenzyme A ligase PaaK-like adenylate-forming protein/glycosyltransferase involved in cell wall biosynthesis
VSLYGKIFEGILLPAHNLARGRSYVRHRNFLEKSQWWPREQLLEFQWQETRKLVEHVFKSVPYYQKKYAEAGIRLEDIRSPEDFARLPVITRQEVNANRDVLRSTAYHGRLIKHATGGSSGVPTRFYITIESYDWRTACTERVYAYTGCRLGERSLFLWGAPIGEPPRWMTAKVKAFETFRRQLVINTFSTDDAKWRDIFAQAVKYRPKLIVGYISSLEGFSRFLLANKLALPSVKAIIAAAEPLYPVSRELIEHAIRAPVFNTYGSREFMSLGGECEFHNGIHVNSENIKIETARPASEGASDILITDLHNYGMPFVRYAIGDVGVLDKTPCPCGRSLPKVGAIEGRVLDVLRTPEGRMVSGELVPHIMKDIPEVMEYRVKQVSLTQLAMQAVLSSPLSRASREIIDSEIHKAFGPDTRLEVERVKSIDRLASGKRQVTIGMETKPRRPRIAIVTPVYPNSNEPYRGIFNYRRARALAEYADVEVFCMMSTYPRSLRPNFRGYHKVDIAFTTPGLTVRYIPYPALPYVTRSLNGWNCARQLIPELRVFKPDLILAYWVFPEGYGAELAGKKLGLPVVVKSLGSDLRLIPDAISERLIRKTLHDAAYVLTVSDDLREIALNLGATARRTRTIRNGCDPAIFHPADRTEARVELGVEPDTELVLFVGRLVAVKGIGEMFDATLRLLPMHPKLQVVCIGEGVLEEELHAAAAAPGLSEHVRFLGRQAPEQVARWLAACNLLCLPSYSEGCPNAILEALFCGRPVVASNVGGIPELVDEMCAILTPPRDSEKLAVALAQALKRNWDEAAIAAHYGRSWEDVGRETFDVCQTILKH